MEDEANKTTNGEPAAEPASDPLVECEKKRDEYLAGWQRAKADFLNYKKEEAERASQLIRYATEELMEELIVVIDNFDLAIATMEKQAAGVERGIYMIRSQLLDLLKKRGLEKLVIESGKPFDPATSESITEVESDLPEGVVVEEIKSGYKLHEKIIRPAGVKVSKGRTG